MVPPYLSVLIEVHRYQISTLNACNPKKTLLAAQFRSEIWENWQTVQFFWGFFAGGGVGRQKLKCFCCLNFAPAAEEALLKYLVLFIFARHRNIQ